MKKIKFIFAATLALAAISCSELEAPISNPESNPEDGLVTLTLSTGEATKTHIEGDQIHWDSGDKIKVFTNAYYGLGSGSLATNAFDFSMDGSPEGSFARFKGEIARGTSTIWAVYPADRVTSCNTDGTGISASIPSVQTSASGSFQNGLNISVAKGSIKSDGINIGKFEPTASVTFKNVCALLKFNIPAGITNISSVTISTNTDIVGDMTIDYSGNAPVFDGITANGSNSITMTGTFTGGSDYYFVLAPVAISELSIYVNTSDNKQYAATKTFSTPLPLNAGEYKSIGKLNVNNMPSFGVDFDIQDDGGFLSGTDVIFTFSSNNITDLKLTISQNDGKASRTINVSDPEIDSYGRFVSSCSNDTSWPYLPKGKYTIAGSYKTPAGLVSVSGAELIIDESPIFAPQSFTAYTSYTKYKSGTTTALAEANACDGASIYIEQIGGISENIYNNGNYADCFKAKFNGSETQITASYHSEVGKNRFSMPAYGHYDSVVLVFDGVASSSSATIDCDVTGLPYVLNPAKNDSINQWVTSGDVKWNNEDRGLSVRVGYALGSSMNTGSSSISKSFYLPSNINVSVSANAEARGSRVIRDITTTGSVSISGTVACTGSAKGKNKYTSFSCDSEPMSMTSDNPTVVCSNSNSTNEACTYFKSLVINYADADAEDKL